MGVRRGLGKNYVIVCDVADIILAQWQSSLVGVKSYEIIESISCVGNLDDPTWAESVAEIASQWRLQLGGKFKEIELVLPTNRTWIKEMKVVSVRPDRMKQIVAYEVMQTDIVKNNEVMWSVSEHGKNAVQTYLLLGCVKKSLINELEKAFAKINIRINAFHFLPILFAEGVHCESVNLHNDGHAKLYIDHQNPNLSLWLSLGEKVYFHKTSIDSENSEFQKRVLFEMERIYAAAHANVTQGESNHNYVVLIRSSVELEVMKDSIKDRLKIEWLEDEDLYDNLLQWGWCRMMKKRKQDALFLTTLPQVKDYRILNKIYLMLAIAALWIVGFMLLGGGYAVMNAHLNRRLSKVKERLAVVHSELNVNRNWQCLSKYLLNIYQSAEKILNNRYAWIRFLNELQGMLPVEQGVYMRQWIFVSQMEREGCFDDRYLLHLCVLKVDSMQIEKVLKKLEKDLKTISMVTEVSPFKVFFENDNELNVQCYVTVSMKGISIG